eukprot:1506815-Prorocentrum_lima.AAC.1
MGVVPMPLRQSLAAPRHPAGCPCPPWSSRLRYHAKQKSFWGEGRVAFSSTTDAYEAHHEVHQCMRQIIRAK